MVDVPGEGRGGVAVEVEHVPVGIDTEEGASMQKRLRTGPPTPRPPPATATPPPAAMEGLAIEQEGVRLGSACRRPGLGKVYGGGWVGSGCGSI